MYPTPNTVSFASGVNPSAVPGWIVELLMTLTVEVMALRGAQIEAARSQGVLPMDTPYGRCLRDAALLTHNGAGVLLGEAKLLQDFAASGFRQAADVWPEVAVLRLLGCDEMEIAKYKEKAEHLSELS